MAEAWTFQTLLRRWEAFGQTPALIAVQGKSLRLLSYAALAGKARSLAAGLRRLGIAPGTPVALAAPNGFEWVIARLAIGCAGAVAVPIDDLMPDAELARALAETGSRYVFSGVSHVEALERLAPDVRLVVMDEGMAPAGWASWDELLATPSEPLPEVPGDAPAMLVYTSGTTGPPKRFPLAYRHLQPALDALAGVRLVSPGERVLLPLPLHHLFPFALGLLAPLAIGATVVFPESLAGPHIREALRVAEVSAAIGVPRLYSALAAAIQTRLAVAGALSRGLFRGVLKMSILLRRRFGVNLGRLLFRGVRAQFGPKFRLLVSGGARLDPEVLWLLAGLGFDVRSGYGLAESAAAFTANVPGSERMGSEGKPLPGGSLRIADPDASGIGEIQLKGPTIFAGYDDNPEANKDAFTSDGWFRTGDLGRLDEDGFLYVTGRAKETIVLGSGKKVNPEDLEQAYGGSPYIREIAVLEKDGALVALIVPNLEAGERAPRIDQEIRIHLASRAHTLPPYRQLTGFQLTRQLLPRTRLGKFRRFLLPDLYRRAAAGEAPAEAPALSPEDERLLGIAVARKTYELLRQEYPGKPLRLDASPLLDLGIDSLEWLKLSLVLEERLGLRLSDADVLGVATVRELIQAAVSASERVAAEGEAEGEDVPWLAPAGFASRCLGSILYALNAILMRVLFRLRASGIDRLPQRGPCLIALNHASDLDAFMFGAALDYRRLRMTYWAGTPTRLGRRWMRPFVRAAQAFPVDERFPKRSLELGRMLLERDKIVVWFPEARRTPDGRLQRFNAGIGHLIEWTRCPTVPVYLQGTFAALPRGRRIPRLRPVRILVGEALPAKTLIEAAAGAKDRPQAIADALHDAVAKLEAQAAAGPGP